MQGNYFIWQLAAHTVSRDGRKCSADCYSSLPWVAFRTFLCGFLMLMLCCLSTMFKEGTVNVSPCASPQTNTFWSKLWLIYFCRVLSTVCHFLTPFRFWTSFVVQCVRKHKIPKQGTAGKIKLLSGAGSYFYASCSQILNIFFRRRVSRQPERIISC